MNTGFIKINSPCTVGTRDFEPGTVAEVSDEEARAIIRLGCGVPCGERGKPLTTFRSNTEMIKTAGK